MAETRVRLPDGTTRVVDAREALRLVEQGQATRVLDRTTPIERTAAAGRPATSTSTSEREGT